MKLLEMEDTLIILRAVDIQYLPLYVTSRNRNVARIETENWFQKLNWDCNTTIFCFHFRGCAQPHCWPLWIWKNNTQFSFRKNDRCEKENFHFLLLSVPLWSEKLNYVTDWVIWRIEDINFHEKLLSLP